MFTYMMVLSGLALLPCCSRTEDVPASRSAVTVRPLTADLTKAPLSGTVFPATRDILLSAHYNDGTGSGTDYFTGVTFVNIGEAWSCVASPKWWPLSGSLDFLGFSLNDFSRAVSVTWGERNTSSVTVLLADNGTCQDDLLFGCSVGSTEHRSGLVFRHAQALVSFTARAWTVYDELANTGVTVSGVEITAAWSGACTAASSDSGVSVGWHSLVDTASVTPAGFIPIPLTTEDMPLTGTGMLVIPQGGAVITVRYLIHNGRDRDGNPMNEEHIHTFTPSQDWEPGRRYIYAVSISDPSVPVTSVSSRLL